MAAASSAHANRHDRLAYLDVLRGIAALLVVLQHGLAICAPGFQEFSIRWFNLGQFGVTLFLLISGFIVPVTLERGQSNARFWVNRFFRLFPLYWATIALFWLYYALARPAGFYPPENWQWLVNLTMLQDFFRVPHVTEVFWTLTLELLFYGACSVLFAIGWLRRTLALVLMGQAGLLLLGVVFPLVSGRRFPGGYAFLLLTMFAGTLFYRHVTRQVSRRQMTLWLATLTPIALAMSYVCFALFERNGHPLTFHGVCAVWLAAYAAFALALGWRDRPMPAWLCFPGRISYSIYLVHTCLIVLLPATWPAPWYMAALFAGTLALSSLTYFAIEMPGMRLGRYLATNLRSSAVPALSLSAEASAPAARQAA